MKTEARRPKTEYRILRILRGGRLVVAEIWGTGWQVVTYASAAQLSAVMALC